tara:strand:- start:627 stop:1082 length:456 start_codon:yes stop_codon:yes gene_type:complete
MNKCFFEFKDKLPENIDKVMHDELVAYEYRHGIICNYKPFSIILKINEGKAIGVLNGYTAFAEIYVDDLWIDSNYRGNGYGRKLMVKLEQQFQGKGFNNINLVTSQFQAPEFYKKCGFAIEFVRENKINPKLTKIFFVKYFNDRLQTQGLI